MTSEAAILDRLRRRAAIPARSGLVLGIGDDCAIFRPRLSNEDLVFTTDLLVEDIHFRRATHPPTAVGHKAVARGLSDIAAMGAEPRFCLLSLALPAWMEPRWLDAFYKGLLALGCPLAGGDLGRAEKLTCDIVVCGAVPRGRAMRRDAARAGDIVYVSGRLGGSALGLASGRGAAWRRHLKPEARVKLGRYLRERGIRCAMDLSDGLSLDLARLCRASGVHAAITAPPRFAGATVEQALHGGEDYELLFTAPPRLALPATFDGVELTPIGAIRRGRPGVVLLDGHPLAPLGYDHFRA